MHIGLGRRADTRTFSRSRSCCGSSVKMAVYTARRALALGAAAAGSVFGGGFGLAPTSECRVSPAEVSVLADISAVISAMAWCAEPNPGFLPNIDRLVASAAATSLWALVPDKSAESVL